MSHPPHRLPFADATNASGSVVLPVTRKAAPRRRSPSQATSLRALAIRVAAKVKRLGPCTYGAVADALVRDAPGAPEALSVRRRVNDALNVLVAAGVVVRGADRVIVWKWEDGQGVREAVQKVSRGRERVARVRERRDAMVRQVEAFQRIVERNFKREAGGGGAAGVLRFPFVVVAMDARNATCNAVAEDDNRSTVCMTMGAPFQIMDDCAVLERVARKEGEWAL